jgi:act minimal PKS chain-length factor (CLF/KS beta)
VVITEQAGGLDSVGHGRRLLRNGARLALAGGIDSSLCPWAWVAHQVSGSVSHNNDPAGAYLPFDQEASGYVPGEGGAIFVLETAESAAARDGVYIFGEIAGYAATFDSRRPDSASGRKPGLWRAAEQALAEADLAPEDIDVVFADAAGTVAADSLEAESIRGIFGPYGVPVTAPKTMTGRLFAGGGSLDLAAALLAIRDNAIPPTVNVRNVVPEYEIDLVRDTPRRGRPVRAALVLGRGRGGYNSAVVVREFSAAAT